MRRCLERETESDVARALGSPELLRELFERAHELDPQFQVPSDAAVRTEFERIRASLSTQRPATQDSLAEETNAAAHELARFWVDRVLLAFEMIRPQPELLLDESFEPVVTGRSADEWQSVGADMMASLVNGVAVDSEGVAEAGREFASSIAARIARDGSLQFPNGVEIARDGNRLVARSLRDRR